MNNNPMTNSYTNSTKLITSNDPTTISKDRVIDPNINTSYTSGPTPLNEFNTHNEIATENTANDQPSALNSDLNQPTENIINTFHITRTVIWKTRTTWTRTTRTRTRKKYDKKQSKRKMRKKIISPIL